jgi:hypothetical protein
MSKSTVTRLFFGAVLALAVSLVVALATVVAAIAGGVVAIGGPNVVSFDGQVFGESLPWLLIAALVFAGGTVAALASWIGALLNTWRLEDKTWFVALLALGLFSLGWIATIAYVIAGPDATDAGLRGPGDAASPVLESS